MQQESPQHKDSILCGVKCQKGASELKRQTPTRFTPDSPACLPTLVSVNSAASTGQDEGA